MKRLISIIAIISAAFVAPAQPADSITTAEDLYKAQRYADAASQYQAMLAEGKESAELYYNLGNAFFKNGDLPHAILYFEKALLLSPNDKDIQHNLAFANSKQADNIEHLSLGFLPRMYQSLYRSLATDTWAVLSLAALLVLCVATGIFLFSQKMLNKKIALAVIVGGLLLTSVAFCCAESRHSELTSHEYAIVIEPTTAIKTEPSATANDLATIHGGIKVKVLDEASGWFRIVLGNGQEGWIPARLVERI